MIIFVGDKPSDKNFSPDIPFVGTQSYKRLLDWIFKMNLDITEICMYNRQDSELSFWRSEQEKGHRAIRFVALGNEAAKQLVRDRVSEFFRLPHPSGLNRKLNDADYVDEQLKLCEEWLNEQKLPYNR